MGTLMVFGWGGGGGGMGTLMVFGQRGRRGCLDDGGVERRGEGGKYDFLKQSSLPPPQIKSGR